MQDEWVLVEFFWYIWYPQKMRRDFHKISDRAQKEIETQGVPNFLQMWELMREGRITCLKVLYSREESVSEAEEKESREGVEVMLEKERELTKADMQKLDIVSNAV
jgi:hypothetical protein